MNCTIRLYSAAIIAALLLFCLFLPPAQPLAVSSHKQSVRAPGNGGPATPSYDTFLTALVHYSKLYPPPFSPKPSYVVPTNSSFPPSTHNLPLGQLTIRVRQQSLYLLSHHCSRATSAARIRQLTNDFNFVWSTRDYAFTKCLAACNAYKVIVAPSSRALRVPVKFVIPYTSSALAGWPTSLHGYKLGEVLQNVRLYGLYVKNYPHRRAALEDLGFQWSGNTSLGWLAVIHAAAVYSALHGRVLDVPTTFVVPSGPAAKGGVWPENLHGLPLGSRLKSARLNGTYMKGESGPIRIEQLDALGFVWHPKRGRPHKPKYNNPS